MTRAGSRGGRVVARGHLTPRDCHQSPRHPQSKCRHVLVTVHGWPWTKPPQNQLPRRRDSPALWVQDSALTPSVCPLSSCAAVLKPPSSSRDRESGGNGKFLGRLARNGEPEHLFGTARRTERQRHVILGNGKGKRQATFPKNILPPEFSRRGPWLPKRP